MKILIAVLMGITLSWSCQAAEPIRFAVGTNWAPPYAEFQAGELTGGILFDLAGALGSASGRAVTFVVLPRKRQEFPTAKERIDIHCYFNPRWSDSPDDYYWSPSLFDVDDVLVRRINAPEVFSIADIPSNTGIGTVLGYTYSELEKDFTSGRLLRMDAVDQIKVLLKLSANRHPYGVSNLAVVQWYMRNTPKHHLAPQTINLAHYGFYCAIPKRSAIPHTELLGLLESLRSQEKLNDILARYK